MERPRRTKTADKSKRDIRLEAAVGRFVQQYGRTRQKGFDPNDRAYDRELEKKIRRMDVRELDALLNDSEENA